MKLIALLLGVSLSVFAVACNDGDEPAAATATPEVSDGLPTAAAPDAQPTSVIPPTRQPGTPPGGVPPATPSFQGSTAPFSFPASPRIAAEPALLVDVRVGAHEGFDRIVFEFEDGQRPAGQIGYADFFAQCGSGHLS